MQMRNKYGLDRPFDRYIDVTKPSSTTCDFTLRRLYMIHDVEAKLLMTVEEGMKIFKALESRKEARLETKEWEVALHAKKREVAVLYQGANLHRQHPWAWDHALRNDELISHGRL